uniref:Uncharacterized protein n=1 Tax=Arundo donax TaxID=35708 RepID=A0A0A9AJT4_ARUDO
MGTQSGGETSLCCCSKGRGLLNPDLAGTRS